MLLENEKHKRYHEVGPKDLRRPEQTPEGALKAAICTIQVSRETIDNEQMSASCPVFMDDSREDVELRLGMLMSLMQDRIEDAAEAWVKAAENQKKEDLEEARKAKELERQSRGSKRLDRG